MVMHTFGPRTEKAPSRLLTPAFVARYTSNQPGQRSTVVGCLLQSLRRARGRYPGAEPRFTQDVLKGASWAYSWNTDTGKATLILPCLPCL